MLRRGALLFFTVIRQISRSHGSKNRQIWPKLGVSGQQLQFEFTDGYEMLHKAWNSKGEVPYCFPMSSIKFQGHTGQNITAFKSLRFALLKVIRQISRSHGLKNRWLESNLSKITRPVAAIKSLRFALFISIHYFGQGRMMHIWVSNIWWQIIIWLNGELLSFWKKNKTKKKLWTHVWN